MPERQTRPENVVSSQSGGISPLDVSEIYANEFSSLVFSSRRALGGAGEAEDVVQEAFLYLLTSGVSLSSREHAVRFLHWKVKNLAIDRLRRIAPLSFDPTEQAAVFQTQLQPVDLDEFESAEEAAIVSLALAKLPARQQESLVRQHVMGQSIERAADEMRLTPNALRQLSSRGRKSFVQALNDELGKRGLSPSEFLRGKYVKILGAASALVMVVTLGASIQSLVQQPSMLATSDELLGATFVESNPRVPIPLTDDMAGVSSNVDSVQDPVFSQEAEIPDSQEPAPNDNGQTQPRSPNIDLAVAAKIAIPEPVSPRSPAELWLSSETSSYLEGRLITKLTNAETTLSQSEEEVGLVRTLEIEGEGIEAAVRFIDDGESEATSAWVYFLVSDDFAGSYWVAPTVHYLKLDRDQGGSLVGVSLTATDFIVGDASGQHQFRTSSSSGLASVYFFMDAEIKGSVTKSISFKTENFSVGA